MIRPQRRMHALLWPLLGALLAVGITAALWARSGDIASPARPPATSTREVRP